MKLLNHHFNFVIMKTKLLHLTLLVLLISNVTSNAQWIQSLTIIPANPITTDTITVLAACSFPAGNCNLHTQYMAVNGNTINAGALHCLGSLTVICNYTDTFKIDPLPAGNYTFQFQIDAGFGPLPCSPGIIPGPSDTVSFVVSPAVGTHEFIFQDAIAIFPNPVQDEFQLSGIELNEYPVTADIFSPEGKLVKSVTVKSHDQIISSRELPPGFYQVQVTLHTGTRVLVQMVR